MGFLFSKKKEGLLNDEERLAIQEDKMSYENNSCRDVLFALLFFAQFTVIVSTACAFGQYIDFGSSNGDEWSAEGIGFIYILVGIGAAAGLLFLMLLRYCAGCIIHMIMLGQTLACGALAGICYYESLWAVAIPATILTFVFLAYYCAVRDRIPFAVELIRISTRIVKNFPSLTFLSFFGIFLQAVWVFVWSVAFMGYLSGYTGGDSAEHNDQEGGASTIVIFAYLISFYWSLEVIRYTLYVTAAGVTAHWFMFKDEPSKVRHALYRACFWNFGSICFAALLISILKAIRAVFNKLVKEADSDNPVVKCFVYLVNCAMSCIECCIEYINQFGLVFVAMYGINFTSACSRVSKLFREKGFESVIQFDLTHTALVATAILSSFVTGIFAALISKEDYAGGDLSDHYMEFTVLAVFIGFFFSWILMQVLVAAINTIFVLWALDPELLRAHRPKEYEALCEATDRHIKLPDSVQKDATVGV